MRLGYNIATVKYKNFDAARYAKLVKIQAQRLTDIRYAWQWVFIALVLAVTWSGAKAVQTNYGLQKQISQLQQQNRLAELESQNARLQNEYYKSDQYKELLARQLGNALPGETVVIVPKEVALRYTTNIPTQNVDLPAPPQPAYQRNLQAWVNFFLHRQQTAN